MFRVLRQRLGYINVLPYIVAFNQRTADEQLNFILADDDRKQWQVSLNPIPITIPSVSLIGNGAEDLRWSFSYVFEI